MAKADNTTKTRRTLPAGAEPYKWKPGGPSPNPGGRPKKLILTDALREILAKPIPKDKSGRTYAQTLMEGLIALAATGPKRLEAVREIMDRVEGKAIQRTEVTGAEGGAIQFETPGSREEVERRIQELLMGQKGGGKRTKEKL